MVEIRGVAATSLDNMVFEYLEYGEESSPESRFSSGDACYDDNGEEEERSSFDVEESKAFWDEQKKLLQGLLYRTNSIESKIRQATKEVLKDAENSQCGCARFAAAVAGGGCWSCLRREVCNRLINLGYDCAICKSKWRSSSSIPSGEHSYLEVVDRSSAKRGETRVVIELNFRGEFEMARASEEYNLLIGQLPEVFVGKAERLRGMIKILCSAAKKCMKEKNMHLGPWRKHKYMQAKWLGTCERSAPAPLPVGNSGRTAKSKASMLTFDLLEAMPIPGLRRTAVEVSVI